MSGARPEESRLSFMNNPQEIEAFFKTEHLQFIPHVSVDCVIFGFHEGDLKVLLLKWKHLDRWSLPGGPIRRTHSVDEAVHEVLKDRTGLSQIFLEQFYAFGSLDRREEVLHELFDTLGLTHNAATWVAERTISIGYYALVDFSKVTPVPDFFSEACEWWDVQNHPPLLFDHDAIIATALQTLRRQLYYQPIGLNLLPEKFTMPELQRLYESVLGRTLDRRNFRKKMQNLGILERLAERRTGGAHRSPYLYRFDRARYEQALAEGLSFGF